MMIPVARHIEDVIADLRKKLVRMLPGSQAVRASWSVLNQSAEMITSALRVFAEDRDEREARKEGDPVKAFAMDTFLWKTHGEYYAACRMVHALADAFNVESVNWKSREVVDVHVELAGADDGGQQHPGVVGDLGGDLPVAA